MGFEVVDGYLLGDAVSKPEAVAAVLRERSDLPATAPFYRAFEAVGARAADEAFLALRLVAAGKAAEDGDVKRLRAYAGAARAARTGDRAGLAALRTRERAVLAELGEEADDRVFGERARAAYFGMLAP